MERKPISAHELNKFAYCPYQWYYERLYGRKELRRQYQERNERLALEDHLCSNFKRGEDFHKQSYFNLRLRRILWKLALLVLAVGIGIGCFVVKSGMNFSW